MIEKITLGTYEGVTILRDDLLPGGTKSIILPDLLDTKSFDELVYASPVYGGFQIALALYCKKIGKKATIFCARRAIKHPNTVAVLKAGAKIVEVDHGYLSVVQARARDYVYAGLVDKRLPSQYLIPFGAKSDISRNRLVNRVKMVIKKLGKEPDEIWCAFGSGLLFEAILIGTKKARVCGVIVGKDFSLSKDVNFSPSLGLRAHLYNYPRSFDKPSKVLPPFPSTSNYDAKAWDLCVQYKIGKTVLFWNVL